MRGGQGQLSDLVEVVLKHQSVGLLVREAFATADDRVGELDVLDLAGGQEGENRGLGQPVLRLDERAEAIREFFWQHWHDRTHEVGGIATQLGLAIKRGAGLHVVTYIRDVHADADLAAVEVFNRERVVEILRVVRIDRECRDSAEIASAFKVVGLHFRRNRDGFADDLVGEGGREIVFMVDGRELGAGLEGHAEALDQHALGIRLAVLPIVEADDHFVADIGRRLDPGRLRVGHYDIMRDARIVGCDVEVGAAAMQRARDGGGTALEDLDDAAGFLAGFQEKREVALVARAQADDDLVALQRRAGVLGRDEDRGLARFGGLALGRDHSGALLAETDFARDEVGLLRDAKAVALNHGELAGADEMADFGEKELTLLGIQPPFLRQAGPRGGDVITPAQVGKQAFGKILHDN